MALVNPRRIRADITPRRAGPPPAAASSIWSETQGPKAVPSSESPPSAIPSSARRSGTTTSVVGHGTGTAAPGHADRRQRHQQPPGGGVAVLATLADPIYTTGRRFARRTLDLLRTVDGLNGRTFTITIAPPGLALASDAVSPWRGSVPHRRSYVPGHPDDLHREIRLDVLFAVIAAQPRSGPN
jgi:hypothetical protein